MEPSFRTLIDITGITYEQQNVVKSLTRHVKTVKTRKRVPRAMENENVRSASLRRACLTGKMATQMQLRGVLKGYVLRRRSRAGQTYIDARR